MHCIGTYALSRNISPSVTVPFLRDYENFGCSREVFNIIELYIMNLSHIVLQVQVNGAQPLWFGDPPDAVDLCVFPCF